MSKKLILFLMVLLFGSASFLRADEVTIGDPTSTVTSNYLPGYSLYNYALSQQIYTADEIGMSGTINDVTLWLKNSSSYARNYNIYMKEVSEATFASGEAWVSMTDADLVATGTLANGISDPVATTFTLSAPFNYTGTGNLVICFQDVTGQWSSGAVSVVMEGNGNQANYAYRDASLYDPTTPGVAGTLTDKKSVVRLTIEGSLPPVPPTGELTITPDAFELGDRPVNGWMEPFAVKINNSGAPVTVTASMSNTAGVNAFSMSEEINDYVLETGDELGFTVNINNAAPAGEYAEEFTLFSVNNRDITTVPVTATFYTAGEADIVETAKNLTLSYTSGVANFSETPANLHANYFGYNQNTALDAVYEFSLVKDAKVSVTGGVFIGIYNKVLDFHPTASIMPVAMTYDGTLTDEILLAGDYYMIVAGHSISTIEGTVEQLPAPTEVIALSPADGATEVEAPVTLVWEGGNNAAQYQVLFGTSPVNMDVVLDWTVIDENYGSYTVANVQSNTQYFWQIKAKNSNGTVETERQGFTTTLTVPYNVTASEEEIFTDGTTLIKWKHSSGTISDLPETQIGSGTATSNYFPTYNLYNYSMTEQIYTGEEIGEAGIINSISFYSAGAITRNLKIYMANTDKTSFTSGSDWVAMTDDNLVYEGNVDMVTNTWVTIQLNEPFEFDGSNLLLAVTDHTGTWTSSIYYNVFDATAQAINIYQDAGPYNALAPAGDGTVRNVKNQIILNKEGRGGEPTRSFIGYNVYYGDVKANTELITEKQYLLGNLPYNIEPGHNVSVTAVYDEGESTLSTPVVVKVSGYGTFTGQVTELISGDPVAGVNVKFNGKDEFNNTVSFEGTTNLNGVYTINNVKAGNYRGTATLEGMEPRVSDPVELAYNTTETVNFVIHEEYKPVLSVYATEVDTTLSKVQWSLNTEISGGGGGSGATAFTEGFEGGLNGWNVLTVNADGGEWIHSSQNLGGYDYSTHAHGGTGFAMCYSFVDYVGAFNTDSYIYTPEKYSIVNGSTLTFFADNANDSYPENFSVVIATADNPTASDFTQVWSGSAKGTSDGAAMRHINNRYDNWRSHSIDLSAYAGQTVYIGFHDVNYDMYEVWIDDVELSTSSKGRAVQEYAIYRKAILKETEVTPADSVFFGTTTDTLYADFDWNNREPGLYQYGVSAIYPSPVTDRDNREDELTVYEGTQTNNYVPMYVFYFDDWTRSQFVIPAADLADVAGGTISALKFYTTASNIPYTTVSPFDFFVKEVDYTEISAYEAKESCEIVYSGTGDFVAAGEGGMITITFNTPYSYNGGNLLIGCENTSDSGYKNIYFYGTTVTGASISGSNGSSTAAATVDQQNFIPMTTIVYEAGGGGGGNDDPVTPITWSNILPKNMETAVTVNAVVAGGTPEGATVIMTNTFENLAYTATFDAEGTVVFPEFRKGNYVVTVDLPGYTSSMIDEEVSIWEATELTAYLQEIFKPVEVINVSCTGYAMWTPIVPVDRYAEKYFVTLDGVYYAETTNSYMQLDEASLVIDETYTLGVAVVYSTGMSEYVTKEFTYLGCEGVAQQVTELEATNEDMNVTLSWNGGQPTPPTPGDGQWYQYGSDVVATGVGASGAFYWGVMFPAGSYQGNVVTKAATYEMSGYPFSGNVTIYNDGTTAPATAVGTMPVSVAGTADQWAEFEFAQPVSIDPTKNLWIIFYNETSTSYPAAACVDAGDPNARWVSLDGSSWMDLAAAGLSGYSWIIKAYVATSNKGEVTEITAPMGVGSEGPLASDGIVREYNNNFVNAGVGFGPSATNMTRDWNYYDTGNNDDAIGLTSGGGFYWGIMFPANTYEGTVVSKIAYYDYTAHTGSFMIYNGGDAAPGTLLYTQAYSVSGTSQYIEIELDEAVTIDNAQNLWLVMHNNNGQYVASIDESAGGAANASCISTDGSTWYNTISAASSGQIVGNWNLRIYTEEGGPAPVPGSIVPNKYNIELDGELVGATANLTFTLEAPDTDVHTYTVYYVDANYGISCPMSIDYQVELGVIENEVVNSIYPNPTSGDLYINAMNMTRISIVNTMGQVVYEQNVSGNEAVIDMAKFEAGVYMVNIFTENGSSVKRVTVVK
jgi:hypothetical protein